MSADRRSAELQRLAQSHAELDRLAALIEREREALVSGDAELIESIAAAKREALMHLAALRTPMPGLREAGAEGEVQQLRARVRRLQGANAVNANLAATRLRATEGRLAGLRGVHGLPRLYTRRGTLGGF